MLYEVITEIVDVVLEPPIPPLPEELPQPRPQSLVKILGSGALSGVVSWGVVELISGGQLPPAAGGTVATVAAVASSSAFMYGWRNRRITSYNVCYTKLLRTFIFGVKFGF